MKSLRFVGMSALALAAGGGIAEAARPAWCKGEVVEPDDLRGLSSNDAREVIRTLVRATCAPTPESDAHRGQIEQARAAWGKRLGMTEADWADAVVYTQASRSSIPLDVATKTLAAASPMDQYAVIKQAQAPGRFDPMYAADMFEPRLSEVGRFGFLVTTCLSDDTNASPSASGMTGTEVAWAICQADFERFDLARFHSELRADTTHDGAFKMKLRIDAHEAGRRFKDHAAEVQGMWKRDEANKQLFEVAAGARAAWGAGVGKNTELLELALAMDSAELAQSRKQREGCEDRTRAALASAVSAIPAASFAGMHDERDNPMGGFATTAGVMLGAAPAVNLAAIAYTLCVPESDLSSYLKLMLTFSPTARGPRSAALGKIRAAKITYDNVDAQLSYPSPRPYGELYLTGQLTAPSMGGVVKSIKREGELLAIEVEQTVIKNQECVASHKTGRIAKIHGDGRVQYEEVCDRTGTVVRDHTWQTFRVSARYEGVLKRGVQFSATGKDVIAVWPRKAAKAPSWVLGAAVK